MKKKIEKSKSEKSKNNERNQKSYQIIQKCPTISGVCVLVGMYCCLLSNIR
jgi:hypothetical protein